MLQERRYLELMREVLEKGSRIPSRNGESTLSLKGRQLRFDLTRGDDNILPILTTKKVNYEAIIEELLWFISGSTNTRDLKTKIWDGNSTREFLDNRGLDYDEGELGPVYGFQWRSYGASYPDRDGIDQLWNVIDSLREDPFSRRHIVSAWNPNDIDKMALPPCHLGFQFTCRLGDSMSTERKFRESIPIIISEDDEIYVDCIVTQRSGDLPLGVPFNIVSYAILTHLVCSILGYRAGEVILNIGDVHIYDNQIKHCSRQLCRTPYNSPSISINRQDSIDGYTREDIVIYNYLHHGKIKYPFTP